MNGNEGLEKIREWLKPKTTNVAEFSVRDVYEERNTPLILSTEDFTHPRERRVVKK